MLLRVCESLYTFVCIEYHKSAEQKCYEVVPKVEAVEYIQDTSVHVSALRYQPYTMSKLPESNSETSKLVQHLQRCTLSSILPHL